MPAGRQADRGWARAAWPVLGAATLIWALLIAVPVPLPRFTLALDSSWDIALHAAVAAHRRFGVDVVFTYGPWGFLYGRSYFPATYPLEVGAWVLLVVGIWWAEVALARALLPGVLAAALWLPVTLALSLLDAETAGLVPVLLLLVCYFHLRGASRPITLGLLVLAAALLSWVKLTFLVTAVVAVAAVSWDQVVRQRRWPALAVGYGLALVALLLPVHQSLADVPAYLRWGSEVAAGYVEAMALTGPAAEIAAALVLAAVLLGVVARLEGRRGIVCFLAVAVVCLLGVRGGYVRHSGGHAVRPPMTIALASLLYLPVAVTARATRRAAGPLLGVCALAALGLAAPRVEEFTGMNLLVRAARTDVPARARRAAAVIGGSDVLPAEFDRSLATIRTDSDVPPTTGTVDVYPWLAAVVIARGLPYTPRPVVQSYSAYTPALAALDVAHLRGPQAPDSILFDVVTIDGRFPSLDDGASWPDLLTRYDIAGASRDFLLLRRAERPRTFRFEPLPPVTGRLGRRLDIPDVDGPLWASIDVRPTLLGRVAALVFKPPSLRLKVIGTDGGHHWYRLVRSVAASGFLLSPVVEARDDFALLAGGNATWSGALRTVRAIRVATEDGGHAFYHSRFEVRLSRLAFPPQDLSAVPDLARALALLPLLRAARRSGTSASLWQRDDGKTVVLSTPPSTIVLPVERPGGTLRVGFGIMRAAWTGRGKSDGVDLRVSAEVEGEDRVLWTRTLDPVAVRGDRRPQKAEIQIPQDARTLRLEIGPRNYSGWDWSYWSEAVQEGPPVKKLAPPTS